MFTRRLCQRANISYVNYKDRLQKLNLESLESRRTKNDLTLVYKIINNLVDIDYTTFFSFNSFGGHNLRRHSLQLAGKKPAANLCRGKFFSHRVINDWNSLPINVVTSPSLNTFKNRLKLLSFWPCILYTSFPVLTQNVCECLKSDCNCLLRKRHNIVLFYT